MSSTVAVKVAHPASFHSSSKLYSIEEHSRSNSDVRTVTYSPRTPAKRPSTAGAAYPMYAGWQTSMSDRTRSVDSPPMMLNRPRKLSQNSVGYKSSEQSQQPNALPKRTTSSPGTVISHNRVPSYTYRQRSEPPKKKEVQPDELFAALPGEVLDLILDNLKKLHVEKGSESCATCWMRNLCNLCLSSRKWSQHARPALYGDIQLIGPDSAAHKKKLKLSQGSRLMLLRRTLRDNTQIAALVRSLKVPCPDASTSKSASALEQYENRIATVIMACPNLERLVGPMSEYDYNFKKLFHALSTRSKLKDMNWLIESTGSQKSPQMDSPSKKSRRPSALDQSALENVAFFDHHQRWRQLSTLTVHCLPGATLEPADLLIKTIKSLPSLQNLYLCNIPSIAFDDTGLLSLPRLRTLSLSHTHGITSSGLSSFATLANSQPLQNLHLHHTPVISLPALARVFSNLGCIKNFSLAQSFPPLMPEADSFTLWMMPYLASTGIENLHWDITSHTTSTNATDTILAKSIAAGGFPALTRLRTPNDPEGVFQSLCRPVERIDLPTDRQRSSSATGLTSGSVPGSPAKALQKSSTTGSLPSVSSAAAGHGTDLSTARLAAQARLDDARGASRFQVNVTEEDGKLVDAFGLAGFIGTLGSPIEYYLHPDEGSSDEKSGLVDIQDLGHASRETLVDGTEGCIGAWNWREGVVADKKENERWWHTERARWTELTLH